MTTTQRAELHKGVREGSGQMFDGIAARYDLLNRIISLGIDQSWRRKTVAALALSPSHQVLDLATGTADLAILVARTEPGARITGLDPSIKMLEVGQQKIAAAQLEDRIALIEGDAQNYPSQATPLMVSAWRLGFAMCPIAHRRCARCRVSQRAADGSQS